MKSLWHFHPGVRQPDQLTRGERSADLMKQALATWPALILMGLFIGVWMLLNSWVLGATWDPYPWILLNLFLSMLAGLQCFILLIANRRGEQIAAEIAKHTLENTQALQEMVQQNTELTERIKEETALLDEIHRHVSGRPGAFPPPP